jgi:molybdopterin-guanine dinucleotide biosynthesis protein A
MKPAGFVLAGGKSRRMGQDKALLWVGETTLLERALGALQAVCSTVAIAGNRGDLAVHARVIMDSFMDSGPLAGIHAALTETEQDWNLFLAVDLPRVGPNELQRLIDWPRSEQTMCVMAQAGGRLQPLCGLYHRRLAEPIGRALEAGERAVIPVLEAACGEMGLVRAEFEDAAVFANLNTAADVATWEANATSIQRDSCD